MKIILEIPDSFADQHLVILAGARECVATKSPFDNFWKVKDVRCNRCGECCLDVENTISTPTDDEGRCTHLDQNGECDRKPQELTMYCVAGDISKENCPSCCITHTEQGETK